MKRSRPATAYRFADGCWVVSPPSSVKGDQRSRRRCRSRDDELPPPFWSIGHRVGALGNGSLPLQILSLSSCRTLGNLPAALRDEALRDQRAAVLFRCQPFRQRDAPAAARCSDAGGCQWRFAISLVQVNGDSRHGRRNDGRPRSRQPPPPRPPRRDRTCRSVDVDPRIGPVVLSDAIDAGAVVRPHSVNRSGIEGAPPQLAPAGRRPLPRSVE